MTSPSEKLVADIAKFMAAHKMTPTAFGKMALGDPNLVFDLEQGREVRWSTESRIRKAMKDHASRQSAAA